MIILMKRIIMLMAVGILVFPPSLSPLPLSAWNGGSGSSVEVPTRVHVREAPPRATTSTQTILPETERAQWSLRSFFSRLWETLFGR